jgi:hypothetical protein
MHNRTGIKGQAEKDRQNRAGRTGQAGQNRQDRNDPAGFDSQKRTRQLEKNSQNAT